MLVHLYTDGGSRGNPGPSAIGFVIYKLDKFNKLDQLDQSGLCIGNTTNNVAEYKALIYALARCQELGAKQVNCFLDSLLVVNQLNGKFKIKDAKLIPLAQKIKTLEKNFEGVSYTYIPREKNRLADSLVNEALNYR
ncbi:ribonuclease H [candidate division WWE3 bacterium CG08_land_8_20_14_0_20_40_13]|uniref:Ribonuclease H n=1 Tax=candidate division WWE3 bacterium CG08_land_8_20_14_0_20_40_13 TaxID=1975084 RepID=A0A2H0XDM3_UNCKA|nr:MAG: ribonuclease H [candidate division WWE3 bacterium CG08_land_8_20_14_0_20_40_13]